MLAFPFIVICFGLGLLLKPFARRAGFNRAQTLILYLVVLMIVLKTAQFLESSGIVKLH